MLSMIDVSLPAESYDDGKNAESHDNRVRAIRKVNGQYSKIRVANQNKEQDEANEGANKQKKAKEQPFAGTNTVNTTMLSTSKCDRPLRKHGFQALLKILFSHISGPTKTLQKELLTL